MSKCEYCKGSTGNLDPLSSWTSLSMDFYPKGNFWELTACGDDTASIKIYYCPFCGRRLEDDREY